MKKATIMTLFGASILGAMTVANTDHAQAASWQANSVEQIASQMNQQKGNKAQLAVYRVQLGDTLSGIAQAADLSVDQILEMNNIPNEDLIFVGQLINLGYGEKAHDFVKEQGQSNADNNTNYTAPGTAEAKKAMNATKESAAQTQYNQTATSVSGSQTTDNGLGTVDNGSQQAPSTSTGNTNQTPSTPNQPAEKPSQGEQTSNGDVQQPTTPDQGNTGNSGSQTPEQPSTPDQPTDKPSQGDQGGQTGNGGQQGGNQGTQTPDKPADKPSQNESLDVNKINQATQEKINEYGFKGQWMSSNDGYYDAVNRYENDWEATSSKDYYAHTIDGTMTKGANETTVGHNQAAAIKNDFKNGDMNFGDYKYGYIDTKVSNTANGGTRTDVNSYFWN